ncbi:MAG: VOC family protein [Candidatus Dormibacteraeota bacterium]|nr:VOC family protein [Candidatus Dormibacteraeota bacterium]
MGQPIIHVEIMGKNAVGLQKFYGELFGWQIGEPQAEMGNYAMVDAASSGVAGGIGEEPGGQTRVTVYVEVPDLQAGLDRAVALGGRVVMPPMELPGVTMAQFADPDGNITGLVKS